MKWDTVWQDWFKQTFKEMELLECWVIFGDARSRWIIDHCQAQGMDFCYTKVTRVDGPNKTQSQKKSIL